MYWTFYTFGNEMLNDQNNQSLLYTWETFKAFVDVIIPRTPKLAEEYGAVQYFGALDLHTDEYLLITLNNYFIPLAEPMALLIDEMTTRFILTEGNERLANILRYPERGRFVALNTADRIYPMALLDFIQHDRELYNLVKSEDNSRRYVVSIINTLNRDTMMGYYSEWSGYGSTRLDAPNRRILEYYPLSWEQIGYPGPSLGYRGLRS